MDQIVQTLTGLLYSTLSEVAQVVNNRLGRCPYRETFYQRAYQQRARTQVILMLSPDLTKMEEDAGFGDWMTLERLFLLIGLIVVVAAMTWLMLPLLKRIMKSNETASEIAESLLQMHGKDRALDLVNDAISGVHKDGNNSKDAIGNLYVLKVLVEVKRILQRKT